MKDVFICHASEDKPGVVEPIVTAFEQANISYWYDKAEIKWGDSITKKVNEGLKISHFVIVVISKVFLSKNFPKTEFHSTLNREISSGEVKVLPLIVKANDEEKKEILESLPFMQDKLYLTWDNNPNKVIEALRSRLPYPNISEEKQKTFERDNQVTKETLHTQSSLESMPAPKQPAISLIKIDGIPRNLHYSGVEEFVGREEELARLHEMLQRKNSVSISAIAGMGGIGKTELALQYARKHLREGSYPGGICWLRATEEVGTQIISFARSCLNLTIRDDLELPEKVTWCLNRWREKREGSALLIFDDVQNYEDVKPFLKDQDLRFKFLITTRSRFGSPVEELPLDVLSEDKALELLRKLVKVDRIDQQLDQAKQLCEWLGYLPLGLELVGRYLARKQDLSLAQLWHRLQDKRLEAKAFKEAEPGMTASLGVAAAFELSWQDLEELAQQLAMVLSLFALAEIPWAMVEQCLPKVDAEELEDIRDEQLLSLHLLKWVDQEMYRLHQLLKEFFAAKREQRADVRELKRNFYDVVIKEAQRVIEKPKQSLFKESTVMIAHLEEAIKFLKAPEQEINLATCLTWLGALYHAQGSYSEAEPRSFQALMIREQKLGSDHLDVAESLSDLGIIYWSQGRYSEAEPRLRQALEMRQQKLGSDDLLVAASLHYLAEVYKRQGRYSEAEPLLRQVREIRQQKLGSDDLLVASSLHNLAQLYYSQQRYREAKPLYEEALRIRQQRLGDNHPDVALSLNDLGLLYYSQQRYREAKPLYEKALRIRQRQLGDDHPDVAPTLHNLGLFYYSQQRYREAETYYLKALRIVLDKLGENHPDTQKVRGSFRSLLQKALQENRTGELSDDPITRALLQQIQSS